MRKKLRIYPYNTIAAISAIVGGYAFLLSMDYHWGENHFAACPFKFVTGVPCPGCGMGRATLSLFGGDIGQSLYYNVLCIPFTMAVVVALGWLITDLWKGRDSFFKTIRQPLQKIYIVPLIIAIIIAWGLNICHGI